MKHVFVFVRTYKILMLRVFTCAPGGKPGITIAWDMHFKAVFTTTHVVVSFENIEIAQRNKIYSL